MNIVLKLRLKLLCNFLLTSGLIVGFNNCVGGFESKTKSKEFTELSSEQTQRFQKANLVINTYCIACHSSSGGATSFEFGTEEGFLASGFVRANDVDGSPLLTRTIHYKGENSNPKNMPSINNGFSVSDYEILKNWVENIGKNQDPLISAETLFQCNENTQLPDNHLNRLSKIELKNTYRDLLDLLAINHNNAWIQLEPLLDELPQDNSEKYEKNDRRLFSKHTQQHFKLAEVFSNITSIEIFGESFSSFCSATKTIANDSECFNDFLNKFGLIVYRRPLTVDEHTSLSQFYTSELNDHKSLITRMLMSPNFLYHIENQGPSLSDNSSYYQLTGYELASRISYLYLESMPPKELLALAETNEIILDEGIEKAIDLLFTKYKSRVKQSVRRYYSQWMVLSGRPSFIMSPVMIEKLKKYPGLGTPDENLKNEFSNELLDLTEHYTFNERGRFSDLLTSRRSFAKTTKLSSIYGVKPMTSDDEVIEFQEGVRSGMFTRAGLIYSGRDHTNPIKYGVDMIRNFKCEKIGEPPFNLIDANRHIDTTSMTTREAISAITNKAECIGCHSKINPYGFTTEIYDFLGGLRLNMTEALFDSDGQFLQNKTTSSEAVIEAAPGQVFSVKNAVEMSQKLAQYRRVDACFIKNTVEFAFRRNINDEIDGCSMRSLYKKMDDSNGSLIDMFRAIPFEQAFRLKVVDEELK